MSLITNLSSRIKIWIEGWQGEWFVTTRVKKVWRQGGWLAPTVCVARVTYATGIFELPRGCLLKKCSQSRHRKYRLCLEVSCNKWTAWAKSCNRKDLKWRRCLIHDLLWSSSTSVTMTFFTDGRKKLGSNTAKKTREICQKKKISETIQEGQQRGQQSGKVFSQRLDNVPEGSIWKLQMQVCLNDGHLGALPPALRSTTTVASCHQILALTLWLDLRLQYDLVHKCETTPLQSKVQLI